MIVCCNRPISIDFDDFTSLFTPQLVFVLIETDISNTRDSVLSAIQTP